MGPCQRVIHRVSELMVAAPPQPRQTTLNCEGFSRRYSLLINPVPWFCSIPGYTRTHTCTRTRTGMCAHTTPAYFPHLQMLQQEVPNGCFISQSVHIPFLPCLALPSQRKPQDSRAAGREGADCLLDTLVSPSPLTFPLWSALLCLQFV